MAEKITKEEEEELRKAVCEQEDGIPSSKSESDIGLLATPIKYNLDLDYQIPLIDISQKELEKIVAKANIKIGSYELIPHTLLEALNINTEEWMKTQNEELIAANLKKAQALQKIYECTINERMSDKSINELFLEQPDTHCETKEQIKALTAQALELHPDMPEVLMQLGKIYHYLEMPEAKSYDEKKHFFKEAIKYYTKAIELKPDYAAAYNYRGNIYYREPPFASPGKKRGNVFHPEKNTVEKEIADVDYLEKAIVDYTEAIRLRPFDAAYYFNRGQAYLQSRKHKKAIADYTNVMKYGSDNFKKITRIFKRRGREYLVEKKNKKALCDFTEYFKNLDDSQVEYAINLPPIIHTNESIINKYECFFCDTCVESYPVGSKGLIICPDCLIKLDDNLKSIFSITRDDIEKYKQERKNEEKERKRLPKILTKSISETKKIKYIKPEKLSSRFSHRLASWMTSGLVPLTETGAPKDGMADRQLPEEKTCFLCKRNCYVTEVLFMIRNNLWICPDCLKYIDINDKKVSSLSITNEEIAEWRTYLDINTPEGKEAHSILSKSDWMIGEIRIISWNCHCGFTEDKVDAIKPYNASILVIPECREMDMETSGYDAQHRYWYGNHKEATDKHGNIDKEKDLGIGVFWKDYITVTPLTQWENTLCQNDDFKYIIPFKVQFGYYDKPFTLIAVWKKDDGKLWSFMIKNIKNVKPPIPPIETEEDLFKAASYPMPELLAFAKEDDVSDRCAAIDYYARMGLLDDRVVIIGDFYTNVEKGIIDCSTKTNSYYNTYCYYTETGEKQGVTDYCFVSPDMANGAYFSVPDASDWKVKNGKKHWNGSDHFPICVEMDIKV